jgi:hypothetical protein
MAFRWISNYWERQVEDNFEGRLASIADLPLEDQLVALEAMIAELEELLRR